MRIKRNAGILIILFCSYSFSGNNDALSRYDYETYKTCIGAGAGFTTGSGLSFKKWFNNTWALQMNLLPYYYPEKFKPGYDTDNDSGYSNNGYFSFGITYMHLLSRQRQRDFRLVSYVGTNINTSYENSDYYFTRSVYDTIIRAYVDSVGHTKRYKNESKITLGGGVGGEYFIWRFSLNLLLGIRGWYNTDQETFSVSPSVDFGIYYML
jgi:hypothetical protein